MNARPERWSHWSVAITGMNARPENPGPGCAVARCLRHPLAASATAFAGRIVGLGYEVLDAGLHQRELCDSAHLLPYPSSGPTALLERLDELLAEEPIDAIIPCLDAELPNFMALEPQLAERGIRLMLPGKAALRRRDKERLPELCAAAGVATPAVRRLTSPAFFDSCAQGGEAGWSYPLLVKGLFYDAYVVHTPAEAKMRFVELAETWGYPVLAQQYIAGEEINLTALGDGSGAMIGEVMMKKQALTDKGKAWAGVSIDDPDLCASAGRLMRTLCWRGPLEIEMLRATDGSLQLIEINPRFPAWIYLSQGVGRNLPNALLALMAGEAAKNLGMPPPCPGTTFIRHAVEHIVPLAAIAHLSATGSALGAPTVAERAA